VWDEAGGVDNVLRDGSHGDGRGGGGAVGCGAMGSRAWGREEGEEHEEVGGEERERSTRRLSSAGEHMHARPHYLPRVDATFSDTDPMVRCPMPHRTVRVGREAKKEWGN